MKLYNFSLTSIEVQNLVSDTCGSGPCYFCPSDNASCLQCKSTEDQIYNNCRTKTTNPLDETIGQDTTWWNLSASAVHTKIPSGGLYSEYTQGIWPQAAEFWLPQDFTFQIWHKTLHTSSTILLADEFNKINIKSHWWHNTDMRFSFLFDVASGTNEETAIKPTHPYHIWTHLSIVGNYDPSATT